MAAPDSRRLGSEEEAAGLPATPPLCVDVDGTLIQTDLLWESFILLLRRNPLYAVLAAAWLFRGRAYLKQQVASRVNLDVASLPYQQEFLAYLESEHSSGRALYLVSAGDSSLVEKIAARLGIFSGIIASDGVDNIKAERKREVLEGRFGPRGYDYAGNSRADLEVWKGCRNAIVVNASRGVRAGAAAAATVDRVFEGRRNGLKIWLRALRAHQWVKNILVFLPVVTSHTIFDLRHVLDAATAFAAFSLCASSVYILNDLLDLRSDRVHATKRRRPFAAGDLSIPTGLGLLAVLLAAAALVTGVLPREFTAILVLYYCTTMAYSIWLKRKVLVDVYVLGGLYTIRVFAGGAATGIKLSPWLLAFCLFFFLSLALVKRFSELRANEAEGKKVAGRGYARGDVQAIGALGTSSGFMSVLVLSLYINSPQVVPLYKMPAMLWFLCPLLMYWLSRVWVLAYRGKVDSDPVIFAVSDRTSYLTAVCAALTLLAAAVGVPGFERFTLIG